MTDNISILVFSLGICIMVHLVRKHERAEKKQKADAARGGVSTD